MTISLVSVLAICMAVFAACGKKHNFSKTYTYNNEYTGALAPIRTARK